MRVSHVESRRFEDNAVDTTDNLDNVEALDLARDDKRQPGRLIGNCRGRVGLDH